MAPQLPTEILAHIVTVLAAITYDSSNPPKQLKQKQKHLSRVSCASCTLRRIAEPLLYAHVQAPSFALLRTLCSRPELALHVRKIDSARSPAPVVATAVDALLENHVRPLARDRYQWPELDEFLGDLATRPVFADPACTQFYGERYANSLVLTCVLCLAPNVEAISLLLEPDDMQDAPARLADFCGRRGFTIKRAEHPQQQQGERRTAESLVFRHTPVPLCKLSSVCIAFEMAHGHRTAQSGKTCGPGGCSQGSRSFKRRGWDG